MRFFNEHDESNPKIPCGVCNKNIAEQHKRVTCSICNYRVHIKCNKIDVKTFDNIKNKQEVFCVTCKEEIFPFQKLTQQQFFLTSFKGQNTDIGDLEHLFPSESIKMLFKNINEFNNSGDNQDEMPPLNCKYVDVESFNYPKDKNSLSLFHLNIASLSKHKDELETVLTMLDHKFDIIGITESKILKKTPPGYDISLPGYKHYSTPAESSRGGTMLYISDHLNSKPRKDLENIMYKSEQLESSFIEIINPGKKNIVCGCIYRHPLMDLKDFNEDYFDHLMEKLSKENKKVFLIGDYNIDLMKTEEDSNTSTFFDSLTSNLFVPHIIYPTRITTTSRTLIDNIFSNSLNFSDGISGNLTISISDHLAQFLIINEEVVKIPNKHNLYKRDKRHFHKEEFVADILDTDWQNIIRAEHNDPNLSFYLLDTTVNSIIDKHMPLKKMTNKELKLHYKPWITSGIIKSIERREKIHKKFIKCRNLQKKEELHKEFKALRNQIVTLCRQSKLLHYEKYFTDNANNAKTTWVGIKSIINIKSTSKNEPSSIIKDGEITSDPLEVANEFNRYFTTIAANLQGKIYHNNLNFNDYLLNRNDNSFFIKPTDKYEILNLINKLNVQKSVGPHSIPTDIFHLIKINLADPLSNIVNLTFTTSTYPDNLKISKTKPIFKENGSKLECSNYRPISLLSNINKIIETLMHERLYNFLSTHHCIYNLQFGFRPGHSTNHALLSLTEEIRNALDNNLFACGIFIDLRKAFDTVDHDILLQKLDHYGIRGAANDWFRSYLSNRKQIVSLNGFNSQELNVDFGVPQGSVLGPLLFLIYINDLHVAIKYSKTYHFADDTNLLNKNKSLKQLKKHLNLDLRSLCKWLKSNKISLNASKTELLVFRHPNKKIDYDLKLKIDGKRLIPSKFVKYLGVLIDPHLNWSYHVDSLAIKLSRATGMLSKVRHYVSAETLRKIYYGIFSSLLGYCSIIWGQTSNKNVTRIVRLQNKAIRTINFAHYRHSSSILYKNKKILKFTDLVQLQNFILVHDSLKGSLPTVFHDIFTYIKDKHDYNTRSAKRDKLYPHKINTKVYGTNSVTYQATKTWNKWVSQFPEKKFIDEKKTVLKKFITNHLLNAY